MTSDNILVAIKSRPFISRENREKLTSQWNIQQKSIYQIDENHHRIGEPYSFDHVFTEANTNADVYKAVVEPLIRSSLEGFNSTIFAYGQTSSGKTYTMMGDKATQGLIQLAVSDIFEQIKQDQQRRYLITCSYFEIYNEKINNLLDKNESDLKIREDVEGNTFISAKEEVVTVPDQVFELMNLGNKTRKIGCTNMNERSSRSHSIFRFTIESRDNSIENGPVQVSQLNLVDLAGSERVAHSGAEGKRLQEGVNINKSLSVLGNVIRQLSDCERHISYRDSKLTRLLQQALGGNTKSLIIATITLAGGEETKSTLEFAQRAKAVKNKPIINEILSESDKLKKHELITAAYKERLDMEKQRMQEMEDRFQQEKIEREKEINKLKQQFKYIESFANGPQTSKPEAKIPRRHTVGHYGSLPGLETIPELSVVPSTSYTRRAESTRKPTSTEEFLKIEPPESVLAEPMDETLRATQTPSPEPIPHEDQEGGGTPPSFLRQRIKCLEESYTSLQEFTRLESEYKEKEKHMVDELVREKENLLKDWIDLNAMIKAERLEKETMKLTYKENEASLKAQLDQEMKENSKLSFKLTQIETENDLLKVARGQELTDHQFLLEERTKNYEMQLDYMRNELDKLHHQAKSTSVEKLEEKLDRYEHENRRLLEEVAEKDERIEQLEKEITKREEMHEAATMDIMSKLYMLQDILLAANNDVQGTSTQTESQIEDEIKWNALEEELVKLKNENDVLKQTEEEIINMRKENDVIKENIKTTQLQLESVKLNKNIEVDSLEQKMRALKMDNKKCEQQMIKEVEQLQLQLKEARSQIKQLNAKIESDAELYASLGEEKDVSIRDVGILTELLSLGNEQTVQGLIEEHQGLLDLFESQLKSYAEHLNTYCNVEMDLFVSYLLDVKAFATDELLREEVSLMIINMASGAENFLYLLDDFSKTLISADSVKYSNHINGISKLKRQLKEKINNATYMDLHNKQLQTKIYKQIQYLDQLDEVRQRLSKEKIKDQRIKDLTQQIGTEAQQSQKKILDLTEETVALRAEITDLRTERNEIADDLERLKTSLDNVEAKLQRRESKIQALNIKIDTLCLENVSLHSKNFDLQHELRDLKSRGNFGLSTFPASANGDRGTASDLTDENATLKTEVSELRSVVADLCSERDNLVGELTSLKETKRLEVNKKVKDLYLENMSLTSRIKHLEGTLKVRRSSGGFETQKSSTELSPREMRRRKRHSLQDQRRGIDPQEGGSGLANEHPTEKDLKAQIQALIAENEFLEYEIEGFIEKVKDFERNIYDRDLEIQELTTQIEQGAAGTEKKECEQCETKKEYIKRLESLHKGCNFRKVDLQTRIFDLLNSAEAEKSKRDEVERMLRFEISQLKEKLGTDQPPKVQDSEVQCDLVDYDTLVVKYSNLKKLARMRREEGNILRAKLGMQPDAPVQ